MRKRAMIDIYCNFINEKRNPTHDFQSSKFLQPNANPTQPCHNSPQSSSQNPIQTPPSVSDP